MGTKVQSKTYFPGYHSVRDLNTNTCSGMWDLYREDKTLENNLYSFLSRPAIDGFIGYEKEQLRQTILKQESVFRHQLQELHRLYKNQRDLMNECTRKELHNHSMVVDPNPGRVSTSRTYTIPPDVSFEKGKSTTQRRMFDLELPADLYDEGTRQVDRIHDLADLNEPVQVEETSLSASLNILNNNGRVQEELVRWDVCKDTNSGFWLSPQGFSQNLFAGIGGGIYPNYKHMESEAKIKEQSTYNLKAENTRSRDCTYSPTLSNSVQVEPVKAQESLPFPVTDQSKIEPSRKRTIFGVDISEGSYQPSFNASHVPNLHIINPIPNVVRQYPEFLGGKMHFSSSTSRCIPSSSSEVPPRTDTFLGTISYSKQLKDCSSFNFGFPSSITSKNSGDAHFVPVDPTEKYKVLDHKEGNHERTLPWLLARPQSCAEQINDKGNVYQMNLDSLQNHSPQFFKKAEIMKGPTQVPCKVSTHDPESSKITTNKCQRVTKILGFPVVDSPSISNPPSCLSKSSDHESNPDEVKGLGTENGPSNYISGLRHHIDLNMALNEEESQLAPSFSKAVVKISMTEIDLEAPAVLDSEEPESQKSNSLEPSPELPLDSSTDSREEIVKVAAEAIMTISSLSYQSMEASASDLLLWFADVVSSDNVNEGLVKPDNAFDDEESIIPEGMDEFEFMTLKLKDTKEEEEEEEKYCYKPLAFENENGGAHSTKRPQRRGQGKRGRQKKDFQKDILPSIVCLARREVSEDLQTFEEAFSVIGDPWESSISKRKAARKGKGKGKGKKRLVDRAPARLSPRMLASCREVALEEKSLSGWGKRTRRLPRQRCTNASHALAVKC